MINLIEEISISDRVVRAAWLETRDALQANTVHALARLRERGLADFEGDPRIMALVVGGMVERMGSIRYVLGYHFDDEEYFGTITSGYLDGARHPRRRPDRGGPPPRRRPQGAGKRKKPLTRSAQPGRPARRNRSLSPCRSGSWPLRAVSPATRPGTSR